MCSIISQVSAGMAVLDSPLVKADDHALTSLRTCVCKHSRNRSKKDGVQDRCVGAYTYTSVRTLLRA